MTSNNDNEQQDFGFMYGGVDDTVNIPIGEYEELVDDSLFLESLRRAGVDNWDGWDEALLIYDELNSEDEDDGN